MSLERRRQTGVTAEYLNPPGRMFDAAAFSVAIRARLAELEYSYRDAAPKMGISAATLHRVATCKLDPNVETFLRVSRWLATTSPRWACCGYEKTTGHNASCTFYDD